MKALLSRFFLILFFLKCSLYSYSQWQTSGTPNTSTVYTDGNVGIGVVAPTTKFQIFEKYVNTDDNENFEGTLIFSGSGMSYTFKDVGYSSINYSFLPGAFLINSSSATSEGYNQIGLVPGFGSNDSYLLSNAYNGSGSFYKSNLNIQNRGKTDIIFSSSNQEYMRIKNSGKIIIGQPADFNASTNPYPDGYNLFVAKGILTPKVKIAVPGTANWSDFVFEKDYKLDSLEKVEKYIKANKHLPGIPSADEVVKEGIDVAKMEALLLQKIEELTLYVIELKKENALIKRQVCK